MKQSLWKIHNHFYDLSAFLKKHPAGEHILLLGKGHNCTELFESVHSLSPINIKRMLRPYLVKQLAMEKENVNFEWKEDGFFYEVSRRVKKYFKDANIDYKATVSFWLWLIPAALLWMVCFSLWITSSNILLAMLTGFLGTSLGFSLFHSASHNALSKKPWINKWFTFLWGDFHGFYYPLWMQHHVFAHHCYTGIHRQDPDIGNAVSVIRKHAKSRWRPIHKLQHWTALPFLIFFPGQWFGQCTQYLRAIFKKKLFGMKVKAYLSAKDLSLSIPILLFSFVLHFVIPFNIHGLHYVWSFVGYVVAMNITYWCIVFPNHDTLKSHQQTKIAKDWGVQQVQNSLSFKQPAWLSQFHGGMNYQIEHHLFPSVSPCHYPAISQIVKDCCSDFNIDYPYCNKWSQAFFSHLKFLKNFGKKVNSSS